jgi:aminotransferase in exopolysaccharide biosynthesis
MTEEFIPLSTPWLRGREKEYLMECVDSGWIAAGPFIGRFEDAVAQYVGAPGAVACSNGTAALHLALRLLDVGPGDEVLTPSLTFVATTNAISYTGAKPAFLDVQEGTWGLDPEALGRFLEQQCERDSGGRLVNGSTGNQVKAVMVVHLFGQPVDMDRIINLANAYNLPIIEDAAESLGSLYKGRPTGNLGRIGCFSFNGNKTITSGGGGMIVSQDNQVLERARLLSNQSRIGTEEFDHSELGYNYRLSNLHAAVGLAQFEDIEEHVNARRAIAEKYAHLFSNLPGVTFIQENEWARSNYWLSTVRLDPKQINIHPRDIVTKMAALGVEVRRPFVPNHQLPHYQDHQPSAALPATSTLYEQGLNLPSSAWMNENQVVQVATKLAEVIKGY